MLGALCLGGVMTSFRRNIHTRTWVGRGTLYYESEVSCPRAKCNDPGQA